MAADGPVPDALTLRHALCSGTDRHLLGLPGLLLRQTVCPKSWISGRKLRISNCSPESQKKEKVSPPGWYWLNSYFCLSPFSRHTPQHGIQTFILLQTVPAPVGLLPAFGNQRSARVLNSSSHSQAEKLFRPASG